MVSQTTPQIYLIPCFFTDDWAFIMQQWTKIKDSVPNNNKKPNVPKSPQLLIPIKSERFEHPSPGPILESVKLEVVQSPTSPQILKPVKTEVFEIPSSNGTDCREASKNAVASTNRLSKLSFFF